MGTQTDRVRFNVRGKIFETSATTLASVSRNSMLGAMLGDEWNLQPRQTIKEYLGAMLGGKWNLQPTETIKEYFIDRNSDCFSALLDLLGTGELYVPPNVSEKLFYREAQYYGLLDHVKAAKICKFDCNWLKLKCSVRDQAPGNWSTIKARPDGGCAVADGGIVRVYNWMLEERSPINLDFKRVNGIEWIDSENIVMGCQSTSRGDAGMGVFSSYSGELRHTFHLNNEKDEVNNFAEALCIDPDGKIFASCRGESNCGIGEWDLETGKQIDFYGFLNGLGLDYIAIQLLKGSNCLFINGYISYETRINLLDFRDKSIVWSWSYDRNTESDYDDNIVDAIPMEESKSFCVLSRKGDLGFVDLRSTNRSVRWNPNPWGQRQCRYPKLILHGGQLFSSMDNEIYVYYGGLDQWALTSSLRRSPGGSIRDFSIGGDRLFALHDVDGDRHSEENGFDVWETPSAPIIL